MNSAHFALDELVEAQVQRRRSLKSKIDEPQKSDKALHNLLVQKHASRKVCGGLSRSLLLSETVKLVSA